MDSYQGYLDVEEHDELVVLETLFSLVDEAMLKESAMVGIGETEIS
jgi:hypothetical protein